MEGDQDLELRRTLNLSGRCLRCSILSPYAFLSTFPKLLVLSRGQTKHPSTERRQVPPFFATFIMELVKPAQLLPFAGNVLDYGPECFTGGLIPF